MDAKQLYYNASNRLLERAATVKPIGRKLGGDSPSFRRHFQANLEVLNDLQDVVDGAQLLIGTPELAKHIANIAVELSRAKAMIQSKIAMTYLDGSAL